MVSLLAVWWGRRKVSKLSINTDWLAEWASAPTLNRPRLTGTLVRYNWSLVGWVASRLPSKSIVLEIFDQNCNILSQATHLLLGYLISSVIVLKELSIYNSCLCALDHYVRSLVIIETSHHERFSQHFSLRPLAVSTQRCTVPGLELGSGVARDGRKSDYGSGVRWPAKVSGARTSKTSGKTAVWTR